jgi:hypothetical protein
MVRIQIALDCPLAARIKQYQQRLAHVIAPFIRARADSPRKLVLDVLMYLDNNVTMDHDTDAAGSKSGAIEVERTQTGVRMEKRLLKVLKALAEYHDITLGDLLEGIVLHAFDGLSPFGQESQHRIADLKRIYHLDLDHTASHLMTEKLEEAAEPERVRRGRKG